MDDYWEVAPEGRLVMASNVIETRRHRHFRVTATNEVRGSLETEDVA